MPTYEYKCGACGHTFERFQKISDSPVKTCPECGKRRVQRLISTGGGIVFKGSGFYATDYRKESPKTERDSSDSASSGADSEATSGGDKPAKSKEGEGG